MKGSQLYLTHQFSIVRGVVKKKKITDFSLEKVIFFIHYNFNFNFFNFNFKRHGGCCPNLNTIVTLLQCSYSDCFMFFPCYYRIEKSVTGLPDQLWSETTTYKHTSLSSLLFSLRASRSSPLCCWLQFIKLYDSLSTILNFELCIFKFQRSFRSMLHMSVRYNMQVHLLK